jgi:hypothetical protein
MKMMCAVRIPATAAPCFTLHPVMRRPLISSFLASPSRTQPFFKSTTPLTFSSGLGYCHLAQARKADTVDNLPKVGDSNGIIIEQVKHIVDMAKRASIRREVMHTDFLIPPVLKESMIVLEKLSDVKAIAQGGYPEAERCRISVGHPEALTTVPDIVAALSISGNFGFQPCSHGDFLGSVLGAGIVIDGLGDILLQIPVRMV